MSSMRIMARPSQYLDYDTFSCPKFQPSPAGFVLVLVLVFVIVLVIVIVIVIGLIISTQRRTRGNLDAD